MCRVRTSRQRSAASRPQTARAGGACSRHSHSKLTFTIKSICAPRTRSSRRREIAISRFTPSSVQAAFGGGVRPFPVGSLSCTRPRTNSRGKNVTPDLMARAPSIWVACPLRSLMTRSICLIIAFIRIFTSITDFYCGNRPSAHYEALVLDRSNIRHNLTEATVPAAGLDSMSSILGVQDRNARIDPTHKLLRPTERMQIFVQPHRNGITEIGLPMKVGLPVE